MIRAALTVFLLATLGTGLIYPVAITLAARILFPEQAAGSLIVDDGRIAGSRLIGQQYDDAKYFWTRPSATASFPYNSASSGGSNYGPHHPGLKKAMEARRLALRAADPDNQAPIPIDLLTASASGLDPDISPAGAEYQAARVARLRSLDLTHVRGLIAAHTRGRQFGVLGEPTVNVVTLNRALDRQ